MNWSIDEDVRKVNSKLLIEQLNDFKVQIRDGLRIIAFQSMTGMVDFSLINNYKESISNLEERNDPFIRLARNMLDEQDFKKAIVPVTTVERASLDEFMILYTGASSGHNADPFNLFSAMLETVRTVKENPLLTSSIYHLYTNTNFTLTQSAINARVSEFESGSSNFTVSFDEIKIDFNELSESRRERLRALRVDANSFFNERNRLPLALFVNSVSHEALMRMKEIRKEQEALYRPTDGKLRPPRLRPPL